MINAAEVYAGSDGELTTRFYGELEKMGPVGVVAMNLFRAQKCSSRAKAYRGGIPGKGSYRGMAYDRKNWSMQNLCKVLNRESVLLGIVWGWKQDPNQEFHNWVLYVDLPEGQVSFHAGQRMEGPEYAGEWDGRHLSAERIIAFCEHVMNGEYKKWRRIFPEPGVSGRWL
jgi:hypothetical protein